MALDLLPVPVDWMTGTIITVISVVYVYLIWNNDYWKDRGVPFEKPKLFFGNYKDVFFEKKTVVDLVEELYWKTDGSPYAGAFRFLSPALLVRDPELVKAVLVDDFSSFELNALLINEKLDPLLARSPFFNNGEKWGRLRAMLAPSFTSGKLKPLFPLMLEVAREMDNYLQDTAPSSRQDGVDAQELAAKYTTDVLATCAFGVSGGSFKDSDAEMRKMGRAILEPDFKNITSLITIIFPSLSAFLRTRLMPLEVADFYRRVVQEALERREGNSLPRHDYLQQLTQHKEQSEFTDEDVTGHAVTFMTEGFETSSIALSFLLYELAMNPGVQEKLRAELEAATAEKGGNLDYDAIQGLPYLNMVFSETLRMHPPVPLLQKVCTKPYDLATPTGGTCLLDPGTLVLVPVKALHYDPRYYPEPHAFDPERFSDKRKGAIHRYAYLPFGEGPRMCIGMKFAETLVKVGAVTILLNYDIKMTPKTHATDVQDLNNIFAAAKGGLWLDFVRRS